MIERSALLLEFTRSSKAYQKLSFKGGARNSHRRKTLFHRPDDSEIPMHHTKEQGIGNPHNKATKMVRSFGRPKRQHRAPKEIHHLRQPDPRPRHLRDKRRSFVDGKG